LAGDLLLLTLRSIYLEMEKTHFPQLIQLEMPTSGHRIFLNYSVHQLLERQEMECLI